MKKLSLVAPLFALPLAVACNSNDDSGPEPSADILVSAAIQADIDGLAGVHVTLTPAKTCGLADKLDDDGTPYAFDLDVTQMAYPDGTPFDTPNDYTHVLGEVSFEGVVPGCYDVVAAPLGADGEPLASCKQVAVPVTADDWTSLIIEIPVECSEVPRLEPVVIDTNLPPTIDSVTAEPMVSACDLTVVCATARDANYDMLEFAWKQPDGIMPGGSATAVPLWPTIISHTFNMDDRSVTQCIAVQAHEAGDYEVTVDVYDLARTSSVPSLARIEDISGEPSHATGAAGFTATLGCSATARSAVILMTLDNDPGIPRESARILVGNTLDWIGAKLDPASGVGPSVLVVLDDNHRGEDSLDGEYVHDLILELGYDVDYRVEDAAGLDYNDLLNYQAVWFVNPGYEMDDPISHTALLRYRANGGGLVLQGDDIARFRGNPEFMQPLTYLMWYDNGTNACGLRTDNNLGSTYKVNFADEAGGNNHPIAEGLEQLSFAYGNDIDHTRPLQKGEDVVAWATVKTETCEVRVPAVVALDPEKLLDWD